MSGTAAPIQTNRILNSDRGFETVGAGVLLAFAVTALAVALIGVISGSSLFPDFLSHGWSPIVSGGIILGFAASILCGKETSEEKKRAVLLLAIIGIMFIATGVLGGLGIRSLIDMNWMSTLLLLGAGVTYFNYRIEKLEKENASRAAHSEPVS